ncbi:LuxR family transcriptional regulator [Amycolatopsis coloradensis]|uniref:LuxR family transcriptional regulator n=1 Tax=Amycolatopsis coloradensis TaxID=76021 RepID=A0A1R0KT49_9PSEU|nr:response regulator transcription factor [Amycolatopsis coloradensis]OLZ51126.1 LuxR family transcriptional regulator [Amycolatopsis coloradensis]
MADHSITAVIADDHKVVAAGVQSWCAEADPPIRVIDAGGSPAGLWTGPGRDADVVILDLQLERGHHELGELRRLTEVGRKVVVYTQTADSATAVQCIELGALAYVTKKEGSEHLVTAIRAAARGQAYTPPSLGGALAGDTGPDRPQLTQREADALRAWFASSSKVLAAQMLNIKPTTIETYIERARVKYAHAGRPAPTKSKLVARALEDGLITLAELSDS